MNKRINALVALFLIAITAGISGVVIWDLSVSPWVTVSPVNNTLKQLPITKSEQTSDQSATLSAKTQGSPILSKGIVYNNNRYGFSLTFQDSWSGFMIKQVPPQEKEAAGVAPNEEELVFGLPKQTYLFAIDIYPVNQKQNVFSRTSSSYLGENTQYVFFSRITHEAENNDMINKLADVNFILRSFSITH